MTQAISQVRQPMHRLGSATMNRFIASISADEKHDRASATGEHPSAEEARRDGQGPQSGPVAALSPGAKIPSKQISRQKHYV
jgi:hypothetical protein